MTAEQLRKGKTFISFYEHHIDITLVKIQSCACKFQSHHRFWWFGLNKEENKSFFWVLAPESWFYLFWPQSFDLLGGSEGRQSFPLLKGIKTKGTLKVNNSNVLWRDCCLHVHYDLKDPYWSVGSGTAHLGYTNDLMLSPVCSIPPWGSWACGLWLCVQRRSSSGTRHSWNASDCDTYRERLEERKVILIYKPWSIH